MPIYEYMCESCGERIEILQQISDTPLSKCPACGKATLKKLVSAAGFRLAGQGWYETDFKTKNQRNLATNQEPKSDAKTKEASKKTDSGANKAAAANSSTAKPQTTKATNTAD